MIEFDAESVRQQATSMARAAGRARLGPSERAYKRSEYAAIKGAALAGLSGVSVLQQYENLALSFARVDSEAALHALLARPGVKAVRENTPIEMQLAETLPFINQVAVESAGVGGAGTVIGVLDSGVNWPNSPFGCTAPGVPATCRVVDTFEATTFDDGSLDDYGHGTVVSGIVAGVAPQAKLAVADVFYFAPFPIQKYLTNPQFVAAGIEWLIGLLGTHNIVAVNLSIGDDNASYATCPNSNYDFALHEAINVGIQPIVSSGNAAYLGGVFRDGLADPGCVPDVVSVGAVYDDANYGSRSWGASPFNCTDTTTAAAQVACFSQTASYLSLLAPGVYVAAGGGIVNGESNPTGTSFAAPHVAGAWAVMRAAMPNATDAEILSTLQDRGIPDSDPRVGGRITPRLELFSALDSDSDTVLFPLDNCTALINLNQADADGDLYGNRCDADYNNTGLTMINDFITFKTCFGRTPGQPGGPACDPLCLESDMNGDGVMLIGDFVDFKNEFAIPGTPGPSGRTSASPVPDPPPCVP